MPAGRPPKPVEVKRRLGNPGKRALPVGLASLPAARGTPDPPRPLASAGQSLWDRAWEQAVSWVSPTTDIDLLLIVCEQADERSALRAKVLRECDVEDRRCLRELDRQIISGLSLLGFTPTDRSKLGLAEVKAQDAIEQILHRRQASS